MILEVVFSSETDTADTESFELIPSRFSQFTPYSSVQLEAHSVDVILAS